MYEYSRIVPSRLEWSIHQGHHQGEQKSSISDMTTAHRPCALIAALAAVLVTAVGGEVDGWSKDLPKLVRTVMVVECPSVFSVGGRAVVNWRRSVVTPLWCRSYALAPFAERHGGRIRELHPSDCQRSFGM